MPTTHFPIENISFSMLGYIPAEYRKKYPRDSWHDHCYKTENQLLAVAKLGLRIKPNAVRAR
jgi:hypothetical protein